MPTLNLTADFWTANRGRFTGYIDQHAGIMPSGQLTTELLNRLIELAIEERRTVWAWVMRLLGSPKVKAFLAEQSKKADARWDWAWIADERIRGMVEANDDLWQLFVEGYRDVRTLIEKDVQKEEARKEQEGAQLLAFLRGEGGNTAAPFGLDLSQERPKEVEPPKERIPVSGQAEAWRLKQMQEQLRALALERDELAAQVTELRAQGSLPTETIDIQPIEESEPAEEVLDDEEPTLTLTLPEDDDIDPPAPPAVTDAPNPRNLRGGPKGTGQGPWSRKRK